jgi:Lrp/AsnC family leucine-responsive transcriptional regulator
VITSNNLAESRRISQRNSHLVVKSTDSTDAAILRILQQDGRISTVDLAERLRLSPTATAERLKRLTREGYITGYGARLDPAMLDLGLLVFIEVLLDKTTGTVFERFSAEVRRVPEILECHMVAGGFDYLLKARVKDMAAYRRFLGQVMVDLPGVKETRTYAVMEEVKTDSPLPV